MIRREFSRALAPRSPTRARYEYYCHSPTGRSFHLADCKERKLCLVSRQAMIVSHAQVSDRMRAAPDLIRRKFQRDVCQRIAAGQLAELASCESGSFVGFVGDSCSNAERGGGGDSF